MRRGAPRVMKRKHELSKPGWGGRRRGQIKSKHETKQISGGKATEKRRWTGKKPDEAWYRGKPPRRDPAMGTYRGSCKLEGSK